MKYFFIFNRILVCPLCPYLFLLPQSLSFLFFLGVQLPRHSARRSRPGLLEVVAELAEGQDLAETCSLHAQCVITLFKSYPLLKALLLFISAYTC